MLPYLEIHCHDCDGIVVRDCDILENRDGSRGRGCDADHDDDGSDDDCAEMVRIVVGVVPEQMARYTFRVHSDGP